MGFQSVADLSIALESCGQFYKHFTSVTYGDSQISCTIHCMNITMQYFQNTLAYFATAASYVHKMFMKLTPCDIVQNLFFFVFDNDEAKYVM